MNPALRLPLLILASLLSVYAALWFFEGVNIDALLLKSSLLAFLIAVFMGFCGIASISGILNAWRRRNSQSAPGEALAGFLIMLAIYLFEFLIGIVERL